MIVFKAYTHKESGKEKFLNILLTISINVRLCLSATQVCYDVSNIVY